MLKSISFENYKAFKSGKIRIRPITVLIGANSSGKSSITQLLLLLKQTFNHDELYDSALKLNGQYINLGEDENLIRDKNYANHLKIEFEFDAIRFKKDLRELRRELCRDVYERYEWLSRVNADIKEMTEHKQDRPSGILHSRRSRSMYFPISEDNDLNLDKTINDTDRLIHEMQNYKDSVLNQEAAGSYFSNRLKMAFSSRRYERALKFDSSDYKETFQFLTKIINDRFRVGYLGYEFKYSKRLKKLVITRQYIKSNKVSIFDFKPDANRCIASDIIGEKTLKKYFTLFKENYKLNLLQPQSKYLYFNPRNYHRAFDHSYEPNVFFVFALKIIKDSYRLVERYFKDDKINYVGPLRAFPQRYYLLDEANNNNSINYLNGKSLAEVLKKNNKVNDQINNWLGKFGLSVSVKEFKDIIHNIFIRQSELDLNITDVGFGISQVLPILVQGFMSENKSLTIIEQPEIHLHPKMQADLGDLFIEIIKPDDQLFSSDLEEEYSDDYAEKSLLIETHSEYLIKRLRRRISEGVLNNRFVALYFINPRNENNSNATLEEIVIEKTGSFEWPKDFYITEFEDDMAFFKNMASTQTKTASK